METPKAIQVILDQLIAAPSLALARQLEQELASLGYRKMVFGGRINQKASIEAASEGDRGAVERLANAFDASLTAARVYGQNHGEIRRTLLFETGLTELASSMIVEIRLDALDREAQGEIITNSRETPKNTRALKALKQRVIELLKNDEELANIERRRQEERARKSSSDLSKRITNFLSSIISDAKAAPGTLSGSGGLGGNGGGGPHPPRPEIPAADPPKMLEFLGEWPLFVAEGTAMLVKFGSDARPPKYSFHGDNPRCFARLEVSDQFNDRLTLTGKADINGRGYGSVTLTVTESDTEPITEKIVAGTLLVTIQATDGRVLEKRLPAGLRPKPEVRLRNAPSDHSPAHAVYQLA